MTRTHESLRDYYACSTPELDLLVTAALDAGALGSRLTGAGFGGCTVMLLNKGSEDVVLSELQERFEQVYGRVPEVEVFSGDEGPREIML